MTFSAEMIEDIASVLTALVAVAAMWSVGHQRWRRPFDMWARRFILGVLAIVLMAHAFTPNIIPALIEKITLFVLLLVIAVGSRTRDLPPEQDARRHQLWSI